MAYSTAKANEIAYRLGRRARNAWFTGHYLAAHRQYGQTTKTGNDVAAVRGAIARAQRDLLQRDWENIAGGLYRLPADTIPPVIDWLSESMRFFRDLPETRRRRVENDFRQVDGDRPDFLYPDYYLQNFHFQTDGWLSGDSARLYDFQVETLFGGNADAMRRQALVPIAGILKGRDQRQVSMLDVACGTGSFLREVKRNYPKLPVTALDLSADYLGRARQLLKGYRPVEFVHANAESMPFDDGSFDLVTCIYLFHELPAAVRRRIAAEIARITKPGGTFVLLDSLQLGDNEDLDGLLEQFPQNFHEPYYHSYTRENLVELLESNGFEHRQTALAFMSKVMVLGRPQGN